MIDLTTVKELRALRLPGMARELESQLEDPQRYKTLSFEDRLALLVDAESVSRRKNTIQRRIHEARLSESQACVEAIEYHEDRELDKGLITKLATCAYIRDNHHVVLKGATGAGVNNGELVPSARFNYTTLPKQEYRLADWLYRSAAAPCRR